MKIYIETLGCLKNMNDTQVAAGILEHGGHQLTEDPDIADAIIVNTCGFINDAKTESIDKIFDMAQYKKDGKFLIVSGCLSQRYNEELYEEMPEVDVFLGVNDYQRLPEILAHLQSNHREKYLTIPDPKFTEIPFRAMQENPYSMTIKIAEGCDNVCAYCVIPQIRGPYRSRKQEDILAEAQWLASKGCKELIIIAQDVTAYGIDLYGKLALPQLLRKLCEIEGLKWIRLMYCYEDRITDELIDVMAQEKKICPYIDIPLQHCSDHVLSAMNRRSTNASITKTLETLRKVIPDIHIRTTLITGFPGETEADFDQLLAFVENMKFERLGVFTYSKEEGTPAAVMKEQIEEDVKLQRQDAIMRRQLDISLQSNQKKIGRTLEVLVEEQDPDGSFIGRTCYDAPEIDNAVIFTSQKNLKPGEFVSVKITDGFDYDLVGEEEA